MAGPRPSIAVCQVNNGTDSIKSAMTRIFKGFHTDQCFGVVEELLDNVRSGQHGEMVLNSSRVRREVHGPIIPGATWNKQRRRTQVYSPKNLAAAGVGVQEKNGFRVSTSAPVWHTSWQYNGEQAKHSDAVRPRKNRGASVGESDGERPKPGTGLC